jgi:hypothetical protein
MTTFLRCVVLGIAIVLLAMATCAETMYGQAQTAPPSPRPTQFKLLFPRDGRVTEGWQVRTWADTKDAPRHETIWEVRDGILYGGKSVTGEWVGTWLLSDQEYESFVLEVEFKFRNGGAAGNGGIGLRTQMTGRPSQNAMELQITDPRYEFTLYRHAGNDSLTGAIYKALAPLKQVYNPGEWNSYRIELRGSLLKVWLNNILVQDADLDKETTPVKTEDGGFPSLSKRPRRGHIGFQDLSNPGEQLLFRNPKIAVLN